MVTLPRLCASLLLFAATSAIGVCQEVGSKTCAGCHSDIYKKYSRTRMFQSSGKIGEDTFHESLDHAQISDANLGAEYRLTAADGGYRLEFSRDSTGVRGERILQSFIGSGRVARAYVFSLDSFLFQAPVSYYTLTASWGLSPGYQQHSSIYLTRAVGSKCLQCHASRLQPVSGTENRFSSTPFLEGGVGCERCHGAGKTHVANMTAGIRKGSLGIVNPARLDPARRDSVCAQCHLTGAARVTRAQPPRVAYTPGELLSDYTAYFVWAGRQSGALSASSHFERLHQSACKRASGDRLWCGSCHDPHSEPAAANRVQFYRARCEKCHQPSSCKETLETRRKTADDCVACHMPKGQVRETEHAVFTDHSIPRRPSPSSGGAGEAVSLESFWKSSGNERDLALAYAMTATPDPASRQRAYDLLQTLQARHPDDTLVLIELARICDESGREEQAMALSERIVKLDPSQAAVAVNLGTYYIKRGRVREAMRLWQDALTRNPALTAARMNLAVAQYQSGDASAAEATLRKGIEYDPDHETARRLLAEIQAANR